MPTHSDRSPVEPVGALGRTSVDVDSRIKELDATGPVLNAGPIAASTWLEAKAIVTATVINLSIVVLFQTGRIFLIVLPIDVERWIRKY